MNLALLSKENLPRERLQTHGPDALSNVELLALILKSGTKQDNIIALCHKLLAKYPLEQFSSISLQQLQQEHGIGLAKASQLLAVFELYKRLPQSSTPNKKIQSAQDIAELYLQKFSQEKQEHFLAIYLDTKNKIITDEIITIGTLNSSLIHPREVFHGALKHCANSLIILHNHPSGDPTPSMEDINITKIIQKTGEIMNIPFIDHIILGQNTWWSYQESIR
ncbi:DNA repair protein RadC [Candidatus Woesearchaeota archaeon]|nr:DNA repair protein RadC [Candidatus Woesearchaeota archaeon]